MSHRSTSYRSSEGQVRSTGDRSEGQGRSTGNRSESQRRSTFDRSSCRESRSTGERSEGQGRSAGHRSSWYQSRSPDERSEGQGRSAGNRSDSQRTSTFDRRSSWGENRSAGERSEGQGRSTGHRSSVGQDCPPSYSSLTAVDERSEERNPLALIQVLGTGSGSRPPTYSAAMRTQPPSYECVIGSRNFQSVSHI